MFSSNNPSLGTLDHVPFELREAIWKEVVWNDFCPSAALRTSRVVHEEILNTFRGSKTLIFDLSSDSPDQIWGTEFCILDKDRPASFKSLRPTYLCCIDVEKASDTNARPWFHFDFDLLHSIEIQIKAPDPESPGKVIQTWIRMLWLVAMLQDNKLPHMKVRIMESPDRSWLRKDKFRRSVPMPDSVNWTRTCDEYEGDLDMILLPLASLRTARSIAIDVPNLFRQNASVDWVVQLISEAATSQIPFGEKHQPVWSLADSKSVYPFEDDDVVAMQNVWSLWLDMQLDSMPGVTSGLIRLQRFAQWWRGYCETLAEYLPLGLNGKSLSLGNLRVRLDEAFIERGVACGVYQPPITCERSGGEDGRWMRTHRGRGIPAKGSQAYNARLNAHYQVQGKVNPFLPKGSRSRSCDSNGSYE